MAADEHEKGPQLRFRYIVGEYHKAPRPRALACAFETEARWVCALATKGVDIERTDQRSLALCEQERSNSNVLAPCEILAENERVAQFPAWWTAPEPEKAEAAIPDDARGPQPAPDRSEFSVLTGTCFAVSPDGRILTAHHVIEGASEIQVSFDGQTFEEATVTAVSPALDVALLEVPRPLASWLPLAEEESVGVGDEVFTLGFPVMELLGKEAKFTDGTISALSGPGGEFGYMQISVPVQPGNSGGPLVNWRGEVVGVVVARAAELPFLVDTGVLPQNINWAVKSSMIRPLVGRVDDPAPVGTRREVIDHTRASICSVRALVPGHGE
jgi:S1-C subfamily serine protease